MLNRPHALITISKLLLVELHQAVNQLKSDTELKSVIIGAEGPKAFSVRGDIKEETLMNIEESNLRNDIGHKLMEAIENSCKQILHKIRYFNILLHKRQSN